MPAELVLAPFRLPAWGTAALFGLLAGAAAIIVTRWSLRQCGEPDRSWSWWSGLATCLLCGFLTWAMLSWKVQETPIVRPSLIWWHWRTGYHCLLVLLMVAATTTDLRAYLIPDFVTAAGLILGVALAAGSGDLQMEHVWVDWNQEIPQLQQAYIPAWIAAHPHWHGLAWSLAGAAAAAGATWLIRAVSSFAMGRESMGLGDVTLMGMIGSFLGWQPVVFVLLLAPLCALAIAALAALATGIHAMRSPSGEMAATRPYLPYGPFLCLATYVVLCSWRWLWMWELPLGATASFSIRRLFGDWQSLALIAGATVGGLALLLFLRRAYQKIPVTRRNESGRRG